MTTITISPQKLQELSLLINQVKQVSKWRQVGDVTGSMLHSDHPDLKYYSLYIPSHVLPDLIEVYWNRLVRQLNANNVLLEDIFPPTPLDTEPKGD